MNFVASRIEYDGVAYFSCYRFVTPLYRCMQIAGDLPPLSRDLPGANASGLRRAQLRCVGACALSRLQQYIEVSGEASVFDPETAFHPQHGVGAVRDKKNGAIHHRAGKIA